MSIIVIHFFVLLLVPFGKASQCDDQCKVAWCTKDGPAIKFPFRLKGRQPPRCGYPGFDLSCTQTNGTVMDLPFPLKPSVNKTEFPTSVKLVVEKIDYKAQMIFASDVGGCLPRLLLTQNLSFSPFNFQPGEDITFFSCPSPKNDHYQKPVPCLSSPGNQVYAVESRTSPFYEPMFSCSKIYNFPWFSYIAINQRFPLVLNWPQPMCGYCEAEGKYCRLKSNSTKPETECCNIAPTGQSKQPIIAGTILGFWVITLAAIGMHYFFSSNKQKKEEEAKIERFLEDYRTLKPTRYSYADIKKITNEFRHKLGEGGYGSVYKGELSSNIFVAVKLLQNSKGNGEDFINEVGTIGRIHHINVVRLVGYCADGFRRALVYEFLTNHSLEKHLSPKNHNHHSLTWEKLQQIAFGIAKGIEYLHQGCDQRILHFDIKPHNILLDHDFTPKISDFGLAKLCSKEQSIVSMTAARGTVGYIAPEMFSRNFGNVSYKSDVYSFGMLLLEMVGERNNTEVGASDSSEVYFPEYIYKRLNREEETAVQIHREGDIQIAKKLAIVGLWCIQWYPANRPSMKAVIQMLEGGKTLTVPPNPFGSRDSMKRSAVLQGRPGTMELEIISE